MKSKILDNDNKLEDNGKNKDTDEISQYRVLKNTKEWRQVEFHLRSSVSDEIEIKQVFNLTNQHLNINFDKKSRDQMTTFTWIDFELLDDTKNSLSKIKQRGLDIDSTQGIELSIRCMNPSDDDENSEKENELNFILCKTIIGRNKTILPDKIKEGEINFDEIEKEGYDSVLIFDKDKNKCKNFKYKINDSKMILPLYFVSFSINNNYSEDGNSNTQKIMCEECLYKENGYKPAKYYCKIDEQYLCDECNSTLHEKNESTSLYGNINHELIAIDNVIKSGKCIFDNNEVEFWCLDCNNAICSTCKVVGSHSQGEAKNHHLEDIVEYYNQQKSSVDSDKIKQLENDKKKIRDNLIKINELSKELKNENENCRNKLKNQNEMEVSEAKSVVFGHLSEFIKTIQNLSMIRDLSFTINDYFEIREKFLYDKYLGEYVWIRNEHKLIMDEIVDNQSKFDLKKKELPDLNNLHKHINDFLVINYNIKNPDIPKKHKRHDVNGDKSNGIPTEVVINLMSKLANSGKYSERKNFIPNMSKLETSQLDPDH